MPKSLSQVILHTIVLSESDYQRLYEAAEKQSRMLSGLRRSLELA